MPSLKDYFDKVTYKPKYLLGDRVRGVWMGIPFAGSVAVDTLLDEEVGPYVVIHLDLPIKINDNIHNMIQVKHTDIIDMKGSYDIKSKTNRKKSVMDSN